MARKKIKFLDESALNLGVAEEMKQQWVKFKVAVTEAAVEQISRVERKQNIIG